MGAELLSAVYPLCYLGTAEELLERALPRWWGRAIQALFLSQVRELDAGLAAELHEPGQARPYTVSGLIGYRGPESLSDGSALSFRVTALREDVRAALVRLSEAGGGFSAGARIALDYLPFEVLPREAGVSLAEERSYADLIAAGMSLAARAQIDFRFRSPTLFKSEGKTQPLPLPALVFRSLLERWNAFSPLAFPEDTFRFAEECVAVSGFSLRTFPAELGENALRIGAVGKVRYRALNPDRYWISILHSLAHFSAFSGIGAGTAYGLGQAGPILPRLGPKPQRGDSENKRTLTIE